MKKKNSHKDKNPQKKVDIQSIYLSANTGEAIVIPCQLNVVKKKKQT
jgi:hypothetical protein